jgi:membrane associated rhomboid family serine protease
LTALVTGVINVFFFSTALLGASGVAFMLITLVSIVDIERGSIPMTFVLVAVIFVGREVVHMFRADNISQAGHIIGGIAGAVFGFRLEHKSKHRGPVRG